MYKHTIKSAVPWNSSERHWSMATMWEPSTLNTRRGIIYSSIIFKGRRASLWSYGVPGKAIILSWKASQTDRIWRLGRGTLKVLHVKWLWRYHRSGTYTWDNHSCEDGTASNWGYVGSSDKGAEGDDFPASTDVQRALQKVTMTRDNVKMYSRQRTEVGGKASVHRNMQCYIFN